MKIDVYTHISPIRFDEAVRRRLGSDKPVDAPGAGRAPGQHPCRSAWDMDLRMFYNDTALYGNTPALMNGYAFFGPDRLLFGTDFSYDDTSGDTYTRATIVAVEAMNIPPAEKAMIFEENARRLLKLDAPR